MRRMIPVREERGAVMVIAAIMLVTLLIAAAIVVDVGWLYVVKSRLQAAADASALAGANSLSQNNQDPVQAVNDATTYVASNVSGNYDFNPIVNPNNATSTFQSNLSQNVKLYFAPIIGISTQRVSVTATAATTSVIATTGVVPFGVVKDSFIFKEQYTLKYGAGDKPAHGGNYGALALGGNGASRYRTNIKFGYQGTIKVGDIVTTEPGNMAGPTDQGVSYRKSLCTAGCNALTQIEPNCPRVVIVPVIDAIPDGGRGTATVVGLAAFFLEDTQDSSSKGQKDVIGRFLSWTVNGEAGSGNGYGLNMVRLVK